MTVHLQAQVSREVSQTACHQSAELLRLGLIQNQLTGRAALAKLSPEKSVLRATLDHSVDLFCLRKISSNRYI
jgi:hypothetical protein